MGASERAKDPVDRWAEKLTSTLRAIRDEAFGEVNKKFSEPDFDGAAAMSFYVWIAGELADRSKSILTNGDTVRRVLLDAAS